MNSRAKYADFEKRKFLSNLNCSMIESICQEKTLNSDIRIKKKVNFFLKNCILLISLPFFTLLREGA